MLTSSLCKRTSSVWEQHQYDAPLAGRQASQGRERQPSVAALSIWEALYYTDLKAVRL